MHKRSTGGKGSKDKQKGSGAKRAFREWCRPEVWQQEAVSQLCFLHRSLEEHYGALVQGPKRKNRPLPLQSSQLRGKRRDKCVTAVVHRA